MITADEKAKAWRAANAERLNQASRAWYQANKERHRLSVKAWREANKDRVKEMTTAWAKANPDKVNEAVEKWRKNNTAKYKASLIVYAAVRAGKLLKAPCKKCGAIKVEAYHKDYTKPLKVIWLCRKHRLAAQARARTN